MYRRVQIKNILRKNSGECPICRIKCLKSINEQHLNRKDTAYLRPE
jgi:hypothetical protein